MIWKVIYVFFLFIQYLLIPKHYWIPRIRDTKTSIYGYKCLTQQAKQTCECLCVFLLNDLNMLHLLTFSQQQVKIQRFKYYAHYHKRIKLVELEVYIHKYICLHIHAHIYIHQKILKKIYSVLLQLHFSDHFQIGFLIPLTRNNSGVQNKSSLTHFLKVQKSEAL